MSLPTLTISAREGWLDQKDRFSKNIAGNQQKNYTQLKYGQLSYNKGNSKAAPYGVVYMLNTHKEALVPSVYHSFEMIDGEPKFLEYLFSSRKLDRELRKYVSSSARMDGLLNITYQNFEKVELNLPQKYEQLKVKEFLKKLDLLLTLHKRKIQVLKDQKNLYLNKMFISQQCNVQLRFKGFTEPWEQLKLGEVFKYEQPTKYLVASADYSDEYQTPVLTAGQSFILGYTDETEGIKNASKTDPVIIFDDFTTGNHYVDFPFKIKSSALKILSISDRFYDEYFTFYSLNRIKYSPQNHQRHWISMFSRIKINIPTIAEQASIGNLLRTIDNMITLHNKKLNKLESLKKEYLNYLFI